MSISNDTIYLSNGGYVKLPAGFSGNYNDLTNKPTLFDGNYNSLTNTPSLFDGTWSSLTGKPAFATIATSGSYNDLLNKPTLFDGTWTSLTEKPITLAGYGITDAMNTSHAANGITGTNISNWNTAYAWGNHATAGYLTSFTETDTMLWKKNGNDLFYNAGNVGIGTTNPDKKITIYGSDGDTIPTGGIDIFTKQFGMGIYQEIFRVAPTGTGQNDGYLQLFDGGNAKVNIAANAVRGGDTYFNTGGNVGIGTTAPGAEMELYKASGEVNARINSGGNWIELVKSGSTGWIQNTGGDFYIYDGTDVRVTVKQGGNVGIGTTAPGTLLHLSSTTASRLLRITGGTSGGGSLDFFDGATARGIIGASGSIEGNSTSDIGFESEAQLAFYTGGSATRKMVIDSNGNVGIGTTMPTSKLQVVGLPEYADNAAAIAAGLTVGAFYRTGDILKVVH
ncbi:MAG: hypothetical protein HY738_12410 [Bacteroidia bacterium]|nr:hypothetical protein [Bacteroidia bacterium]